MLASPAKTNPRKKISRSKIVEHDPIVLTLSSDDEEDTSKVSKRIVIEFFHLKFVLFFNLVTFSLNLCNTFKLFVLILQGEEHLTKNMESSVYLSAMKKEPSMNELQQLPNQDSITKCKNH